MKTATFVLIQHKLVDLRLSVLRQHEFSVRKNEVTMKGGGHVRKVGNCVPCAPGCGRMRSHFRLDPTTRPGGCLSVDTSGPHVPGIWPALDDSQFVVTRSARCFSGCSLSNVYTRRS